MLFSLNNLGALYLKTKQYEKAASALTRILGIQIKTIGPNHSRIATSLGNLGELYLRKGELVKSEAYQRRALRIREKAFDPEHLKVAKSLYDLARVQTFQVEPSKFAESEKLLHRALRIRRKKFGNKHLRVAQTLEFLSLLYRISDRTKTGAKYLQQAKAIRKELKRGKNK